MTEEHKPTLLGQHTVSAAPVLYPTRLSTVTVKFPLNKSTNSPGLSQLLGGGKEKDAKKEKTASNGKDKDDGQSVSSSDTPDDGNPSPDVSNSAAPEATPSTPIIPHEQHNTLFSHPGAGIGKKKSSARPKHNMRTTSSTFITRLQNADNLSKILQSKQGESTFIFYNSAKSFFWTEAGVKVKVKGHYIFLVFWNLSISRTLWHEYSFLLIRLAMT